MYHWLKDFNSHCILIYVPKDEILLKPLITPSVLFSTEDWCCKDEIWWCFLHNVLQLITDCHFHIIINFDKYLSWVVHSTFSWYSATQQKSLCIFWCVGLNSFGNKKSSGHPERELRALNDIAKQKPEIFGQKFFEPRVTCTPCIIGSHNTGQIKWTHWVYNILVRDTGHS